MNKNKVKIAIRIVNKAGWLAKRLYRLDTRVLCHFELEFTNEEMAKEFVKKTGVDVEKVITALKTREKGYFTGTSWRGEERMWEEEIKKEEEK